MSNKSWNRFLRISAASLRSRLAHLKAVFSDSARYVIPEVQMGYPRNNLRHNPIRYIYYYMYRLLKYIHI
jgi:hypothetical protein